MELATTTITRAILLQLREEDAARRLATAVQLMVTVGPAVNQTSVLVPGQNPYLSIRRCAVLRMVTTSAWTGCAVRLLGTAETLQTTAQAAVRRFLAPAAQQSLEMAMVLVGLPSEKPNAQPDSAVPPPAIAVQPQITVKTRAANTRMAYATLHQRLWEPPR